MPILSGHLATMGGALFSVALTLVCMSAQASNSLCAPTENVFFSCQAGKKIVSLCASADLSRDAGTLAVKSRLIINALNKKVGLQALPFFE